MAPPNVRISKKLASAKKSLSRDKSSGDDNTNDYGDTGNNISSSSQQQPPPGAPSNNKSSSASSPSMMSKRFANIKKPNMLSGVGSSSSFNNSDNTNNNVNVRRVSMERKTSSGGEGFGADNYLYSSTNNTNRKKELGSGTGGKLTNRGAYMALQPFETSEGARRLNRILDSTNTPTSSSNSNIVVGSSSMTEKKSSMSSGGVVVAGRSSMRGGKTSSSSQGASLLLAQSSSSNLNSNARDGFALTTSSLSTGVNSGGGGSSSNNDIKSDYIPPSTIQLPDPTDERAVGEMTCRISSKMKVDLRSIGGRLLMSEGKVEARTGNVLLRDGWEEMVLEGGGSGSGGEEDSSMMKLSSSNIPTRPMNRLTNECLFSMCVSQFDLSVGVGGGPSGGKKRHIPIAKSRNKLRYVVIVRSTNRPLLRPRGLNESSGALGMEEMYDEDGTNDGYNDGIDTLGSDDGYDNMYNPEGKEGGEGGSSDGGTLKSTPEKKKRKGKGGSSKADAHAATAAAARPKKKKLYEEYNCGIPPSHEISSFPALFCLAIHADGTKPDVRKVLELDKLVSIENAPPRKNAPSGSAGPIILVFRNGDAVEVDCDLPNAGVVGAGGGGGPDPTSSSSTSAVTKSGGGSNSKKNTAMDATNRLRKERFLWSLLQVHAILCTSVVERTVHAASAAALTPGSSTTLTGASGQLPPLVVRNVDRGELQYVSTVNSFLTDSPVLCSLLDRQSGKTSTSSGGPESSQANALTKKESSNSALDEEGKSPDDMDGMAYDMMMGNYNRAVALFVNEEEKQDAADVLNATSWQQQEITVDGMANVDALGVTAESLIRMLQQRMRDLEAETCRRLISWEDEKYYSALGGRPKQYDERGVLIKTTKEDAMSVNDLYVTLQNLDDELERMEEWIHDRTAMIKPITDECRGIEEENRMLEQQWVSYETLGTELKRLLGGLVLPPNILKVLENPGSVIVYHRTTGAVDIDRSEQGVESIYQAGQALKQAIDTAEGQGGVHLRAVSDTIQTLTTTSNKFCGSLARIVVTVMEQMAKEVCSRQEAAIGKGDTHTSISKKIREVSSVFISYIMSNQSH